MEKKEFLDSLNTMRTGLGNYSLCNDIYTDIKSHLELADTIINDLSINICEYFADTAPSKVMCAEYCLCCFSRVLEFCPEKARAVFKTLKEMAKIKMVFTENISTICVELINKIARKYSTSPDLMTEMAEIFELLRKNNPWADKYLK